MAVTSKELNDHGATRTARLPRNVGRLAYLITFLLAALAIYVLVGAAVRWGQVHLDDLRYGRPRTSHIEGFVGHEASGSPTRLIGMNIARQVVLLELPGGDASQVRSLPGPYLFGADEDLTPVLLSLHDIDGDGQDDLIVSVRNERIIYLNRDGGFRLPTSEEQQRIVQELGT
ncbi:MAG: VCBS repeat-containing protein [Chloroflexales bacterium]|nr:VCBS repeat-containing protein [Chloroflexales bacterium]